MPGQGGEMAEGAGIGEFAPTNLPQHHRGASGRAHSISRENKGCIVPEHAVGDLGPCLTCPSWPSATLPLFTSKLTDREGSETVGRMEQLCYSSVEGDGHRQRCIIRHHSQTPQAQHPWMLTCHNKGCHQLPNSPQKIDFPRNSYSISIGHTKPPNFLPKTFRVCM